MQEPLPLPSLSNQILAHWIQFRLEMVRSLRGANQLETAAFATQETCAEMPYLLMVIQKLSYPAAWETVEAEWALPEEISSAGACFPSPRLTLVPD